MQGQLTPIKEQTGTDSYVEFAGLQAQPDAGACWVVRADDEDLVYKLQGSIDGQNWEDITAADAAGALHGGPEVTVSAGQHDVLAVTVELGVAGVWPFYRMLVRNAAPGDVGQGHGQMFLTGRTRSAYPAAAGGFPLDGYTGLKLVFAMQRMLTSYTGPAVKLRRDSDDTELDVGFLEDGSFDEAAADAFIGAGVGYISVWYDQTETSDALQATLLLQPTYDAGQVRFDVDRTACLVLAAPLDLYDNSAYTAMAWVKLFEVGSSQVVMSDLLTLRSQLTMRYNSDDTWCMTYSDPANARYGFFSQVAAPDQWYHWGWINGANSDEGQQAVFDGVEQALSFSNSGTPAVPLAGYGALALGKLGSAGGQHLNGWLDGVVVFDVARSVADVQAIRLATPHV